MPYALFEDDVRLTRSFATEQDVLAAAERAGLVETSPDGRKLLEDNLSIRPCDTAPDDATDSGYDFIVS
ncbi:MAG TPA: hypothetical protein VKY22_16460 [Bradyrhizobium sp.]|nr:hypothetical protein [Bradyrhizobium sp.]